MYDYEGDDVKIQEMPSGCIITDAGDGQYLVVASKKDALAVIDSLFRMIYAMENK